MRDASDASNASDTSNAAGGLFGIIPLKRLDHAKSRLAGVLSPGERATLALSLAERTLAALRDSGACERLVVVSPDPTALGWAEAQGAVALAQPGAGLNAGLAQARAWAVGQGATGLLIALGDLPLLTADEVRRFVMGSRPHERMVAVAPDRAHDGTNLLLARPASLAPLAYGRGSFARHQRLARRLDLRVVTFHAPGMAFDVDTPADLSELIARGVWSPGQPARQGE